MDDAALVRVLQSCRDLRQNESRRLQWQQRLHGNHRVKTAPIDELHHDRIGPLTAAHRIDRHHVRVLQRRDGAPLAKEPLGHVLIARDLRQQQLDRHTTFERWIERQKHRRHATAAKFLLDYELGAEERLKLRAQLVRRLVRHAQELRRFATRVKASWVAPATLGGHLLKIPERCTLTGPP